MSDSPAPTLKDQARRELNSLRGIVVRAEHQGLGRNEMASRAAARRRFELALRSILAIEDNIGVDAAGSMSDRLTILRRRAIHLGLLTLPDVADIEERVIV